MNQHPDNPCNSDNFEVVWLNCSSIIYIERKAPLWVALPVYGYVTPVITAITLITNTFVVLVLSRKHLRSPTNAVLMAMAVTELLTGLCSLPWSLYYYTFGGHVSNAMRGLPAFWCEYFPYISEIIPTIFHTSAIWLTVYLAVQRYVYVVRSSAHQNAAMTMRATRIIITLICITAFLIEIPKMLSSYHESRLMPMTQSNSSVKQYRICIYNYSPWVVHVGVDTFFSIYYWSLALFVHAFPCLLLMIFTAILVYYIRLADKRRRKAFYRNAPPQSTQPVVIAVESSSNSVARVVAASIKSPLSNPTTESSRQRRSYFHSTTKMLVVVITIFLVIEIPAAVVYILHIFLVTFKMNLKLYQAMNIIFILRNMLILLSYPFNFAVYCGMSQQFRLTVRQLITKERITFYRQPELESSRQRSHRRSSKWQPITALLNSTTARTSLQSYPLSTLKRLSNQANRDLLAPPPINLDQPTNAI